MVNNAHLLYVTHQPRKRAERKNSMPEPNSTTALGIAVGAGIGLTGTGITVAAGKRAIVYADGTNIVRAGADI